MPRTALAGWEHYCFIIGKCLYHTHKETIKNVGRLSTSFRIPTPMHKTFLSSESQFQPISLCELCLTEHQVSRRQKGYEWETSFYCHDDSIECRYKRDGLGCSEEFTSIHKISTGEEIPIGPNTQINTCRLIICSFPATSRQVSERFNQIHIKMLLRKKFKRRTNKLPSSSAFGLCGAAVEQKPLNKARNLNVVFLQVD